MYFVGKSFSEKSGNKMYKNIVIYATVILFVSFSFFLIPFPLAKNTHINFGWIFCFRMSGFVFFSSNS